MISSGPDSMEEVSPYIVFADLATNLVLILMFFVAALTVVGQIGWEQVRYVDEQERVRDGIFAALPPELRPREERGRNDPPGVQRWVFASSLLFAPESTELSSTGETVLTALARALDANCDWRRIRIEGHTLPTQLGEDDAWELSAEYAATVARVFTGDGHIRPWFLAIAGRAGQNPVNGGDPFDPANQRVEILLEYSAGANYCTLKDAARPETSL